LLERFVAQQEEASFSLLMRRHGPLVLGLCRRLLGNDMFLTRLGTISESGAPVNRPPLFGAPPAAIFWSDPSAAGVEPGEPAALPEPFGLSCESTAR
jgi:hypothetical protein